jgi:hypothetical protein
MKGLEPVLGHQCVADSFRPPIGREAPMTEPLGRNKKARSDSLAARSERASEETAMDPGGTESIGHKMGCGAMTVVAT